MLTIAAVAAHKGIAPQQIEVRIERSTSSKGPWKTSFGIEVDLGEGLCHRERVILFNAARRCEVHKLLSGDMSFDYRIAGDPAGPQRKQQQSTAVDT